MVETTTRLGPSGRVVIPAEYRKAMGIDVGDEVILRLEGGEIRMRGRAEAIRQAQALVRRYVGSDRCLSGELIAERRVEAERE